MTHLLPAGRRQVADDPGKLAPDVSDGLHARLHDPLLQFSGDQIKALRSVQEGRVLLRGGELQDLIAGQDQFAHQVHQLVEQAHIDANVAVGDGRGVSSGLNLQGLEDCGGWWRLC